MQTVHKYVINLLTITFKFYVSPKFPAVSSLFLS